MVLEYTQNSSNVEIVFTFAYRGGNSQFPAPLISLPYKYAES